MLRSYFQLDDPIDDIYDDISRRDTKVKKLAQQYPWLRVLRQPDPWECMASYICSANNSVPRIIEIVESIARELGDTIELCGDLRYTFPSPKTVFGAGVERLENLRLGLDRHSKIYEAAKRICDGELDLNSLTQPNVSYDETIRQLKGSYGIGDKIADCIALFTLNKTESFPVDVWVKRAVEECSDPPPRSTYRAIVKWAQSRFGKYAGFANQFLFLGKWLRENPNNDTDEDGNPSTSFKPSPPPLSLPQRLISSIRRRFRR